MEGNSIYVLKVIRGAGNHEQWLSFALPCLVPGSRHIFSLEEEGGMYANEMEDSSAMTPRSSLQMVLSLQCTADGWVGIAF